MLSASPPPAPAAALIGRATEVEDVLDLLGRARLVTLTGPPGVGKTRLALAVCADRDDVSWVDLAPVRDPRPGAGRARPGRATGGRRPTPRIGWSSSTTVSTCSTPTWPVSSPTCCARPLGCRCSPPAGSGSGWRPSASTPYRRYHALGRRRRRPRSPARQPGRGAAPGPGAAAVQLTPNTARALAEICVGLDGLPLAIELAAARLRVFTPSELAFRLGRRMSVLTSGPRDAPDRHRDLRAAIAWSHDLLSEPRPRGLPAAVGVPRGVGPRERRGGVRRARRPRRGRVAAGQEPGPPGRGGTPTATPGSRC